MDINNLKSCISHDEAMIRSFIRDPEFAEYYLHTVILDGDNEEILQAQSWYDEAKSRSVNMHYWDSIISNAEKTAHSGYNIDNVISRVSQALAILQAALPAQA